MTTTVTPSTVEPGAQQLTDDGLATSAPARIVFRQPVSTTGFIDAAWWPRSRDLTVELPGLLEVFWTAARDISHVTYHWPTWGKIDRRLQGESKTVKLGAFSVGEPDVVICTDAWGGDRIDVLAVPPDASADEVRRVFALVAAAGSSMRPGEIFSAAAVAPFQEAST